MKTFSPLPLVLLAVLSGPAFAETLVKASPGESCPLVGPLTGASEDCSALRSAYRMEVSTCMDRLRAEADARAGQRTTINSHTNRSRYLTCDKGAREKLAHLTN